MSLKGILDSRESHDPGIASQRRFLDDLNEIHMNAHVASQAMGNMQTYNGTAQGLATREACIGHSAGVTNVLQMRYLLKDRLGKVDETPSEMFRRVARVVSRVERLYAPGENPSELEDKFYRIMSNLDFLPNSPTLMNAGTPLGQLAACFVLPVEDSMDGIFQTLRYMALIQQSGAGVGFSFSRLRPEGDMLMSTMGQASGPVSFMEVFDHATLTIQKGGKRRGANMGILSADHPDILQFVRAKASGDVLSSFNLSVAVTDDFMSKVTRDEEYDLKNPHNGKPIARRRASEVFDLIAQCAWKTGDPGLVFIDEIDRWNPTPLVGKIESTNPCGEQPLLPYESCNLGSVNLSHMYRDGRLDKAKLSHVVRLAVHFLDDVIDSTKFPFKRMEGITKANRKIGLGVMGFADLLAKMRIPYDSAEALVVADDVMTTLYHEAFRKSVELAEERGPFPNFEGSLWDRRGFPELRNATLTTVAPTGTLSLIANCSSGIEPMFAISYVREVMNGTRMRETNPVFDDVSQELGFHSEKLIDRICEGGSIKEIAEIPEDVRRIFVTALDISPEWHVRMQAAFQRHCDNAVSKTVNLPEESTVEDVRRVFLLAHELKCKGSTVFRYGSKKQQVLRIGRFSNSRHSRAGFVVPAGYAGNCMTEYCTV
ncbi:MAG: adenosylcobalamin-dependent ribonucleoside-diphosphate reductase [Candidatus Bathyarchaeia archaeon]